MKYLYIFIISLVSINLTPQSVWRAELDSIQETSYYNIKIDQEIIGNSRNSLSDLRIRDEKGLEIPYFLREATSVKEISSFEDYNLLQTTIKDSLNILVVDNQSQENINRFYIIINKADVKVEASIRGSYNGKQWFIVKQRTEISISEERGGSEAMIIVDFPNGNYNFYEVSLFSNQINPLNIKGVKKIKSSHIYGNFTEIRQAKKIKVENRDKQTLIYFPDLSDEFIIGKMEVFINSKAQYLRSLSIKDTLINQELINVKLSSKSNNTFYLFSDYTRVGKNSIAIIDNEHNPPLSIDSIKIYGQERYACAYLEKGIKYFLKIDKDASLYPNYDIAHFKNDISSNLPEVKSANLTKQAIAEPIGREQLFIEKPIFLWSVIIGVGILLTIVSVSMLIKMKKREDPE